MKMSLSKITIILLITAIWSIAFGQASGSSDNLWHSSTEYSFILQDSPAQLFTMRQVDESYLSAYRLMARSLYEMFDEERYADLIQVGLLGIFLMPLTHEEGHRSILTGENIGSISQPYFNKDGAAYVIGVTDETLMKLRDENLPAYIRLHTGGLESDYMLTRRMEKIGSFQQDDFRNYKWEYWIRKTGIIQYYITGLFDFDIDIEEESDELERDIVGYDTYGQARHLHRPDMEFYRYTEYDEMTSAEKEYVDRMAWRSLLNLANPLIIGKSNFTITEDLSINGGMGYTMAPFGDFVDENIWLKYRRINIGLYARQFQNRDEWFHGAGFGIYDLQPMEKLSMSIEGHFWNQPKDYDFNTGQSFTGGAIDANMRYFFMIKPESFVEGISIDLGVLYKTEGFLPEELHLDEHLGFRFGTSLRI